MKKIVYVLPNSEKSNAVEDCDVICNSLGDNGFECRIASLPVGCDAGQCLADADYLIVLGGDGTIIQVARATVGMNIPIVGMNYGNIGYMAAVAKGDVASLIDILDGGHLIQERMMLDVDIIKSDHTVRALACALNEAVISNGPIPHLVEFELYCDGYLCQHVRSDGMIIATPTGSSAYSMSAGGPIMDPQLSCICATPICPHHLNARPVIFGGDSVIEIKNAKCRNNGIYLSVDGKEVFEVGDGDVIRISRSKHTVPIVTTGDHSFMEVLDTKLSSH